MGDFEDGNSSPSEQGKSEDHSGLRFAAINSEAQFSQSVFFDEGEQFVIKVNWTTEEIVRNCGFGSLLYLKCTQYSKDLVVSLAKKYDIASRSVKFDDSNYFVIDPFTVHQIVDIYITDFSQAKSLCGPSHAKCPTEQSVVKILDKSWNMSLKVVCGEELHPDVDNFINSSISGQDNGKGPTIDETYMLIISQG
ncbi:hypothetical protein EJB05_42857 [Eragrostis curvula]|uniref:Uncharacterized protein n=1 Tax=Eragrostis curvula TaxID=38414 RepID=A0A5J9TDC8_9POAL|nr:hypothetical protein EJB05_42857 [Eragrostis curvula]